MSISTPPQVYHILEEVRFLADHVGGMTEAEVGRNLEQIIENERPR